MILISTGGQKRETAVIIHFCKVMASGRRWDRLSRLPDDLLVHILSFLPLLEAICTSILSKRWECMWTLITSLDFTKDTFDELLRKRSEIINHVLAQHKAPTLSAFRLFLFGRADVQHDSWITFAVSRHVRRLALDLINYELPPYLFHYSNALTYLELKSCIITMPQLPFCLCSLKILHIGETTLGEPLLLERLTLSACCPILEMLQLTGCNLLIPFIVSLTNPSLTHLCFMEGASQSLDISAPYVSHLELLGKWSPVESIMLKHMSSLTQATIDLDDSIEKNIIISVMVKVFAAFPPHIKLNIISRYQTPYYV